MTTSFIYPEWVPESYIEADNLWQKAKSLKEFEDTDEKFLIGGYLTDTITDVSIQDYPVADHDLTKVEVNFGPYDVGQKTLQVTYDNEDKEIKSKSLHEAGYEDFDWLCDPDDIRIAGVDDTEEVEEYAYGQTD